MRTFDMDADGAWNTRADTAPRWIAVEERLPEAGVTVIAYRKAYPSCPKLLHWYEGDWYNSDGICVVDQDFWLPLPPKPASEAGGSVREAPEQAKGEA